MQVSDFTALTPVTNSAPIAPGGEPLLRNHSKGMRPMPSRTEVEEALRRLAPKIPPHEFMAVADHAMDSAGLRRAPPETAAWLSLVAYVRHAHTEYDALLGQGYDVDSARHFVAQEMADVLAEWAVRRRLADEGT